LYFILDLNYLAQVLLFQHLPNEVVFEIVASECLPMEVAGFVHELILVLALSCAAHARVERWRVLLFSANGLGCCVRA
jgi:hypothetical protein